MVKLRYSLEEIGRRGDLLYEQEVEPRIVPEQHGQVVALDIDSGDFEIAADSVAATDRLLVRRPDAQIWLRRVGFPYLSRRVGRRSMPVGDEPK